MIQLENVTVMLCSCERKECRHAWYSFRLDADGKLVRPPRCPRCKFRNWDGIDHRRADPYELVPQGSVIVEDGKVMAPKALLEALTEAKAILENVISDLGPCDHGKKVCVCPEKKVLNKITMQIDVLTKLGRKNKSPTTTKTKPRADGTIIRMRRA